MFWSCRPYRWPDGLVCGPVGGQGRLNCAPVRTKHLLVCNAKHSLTGGVRLNTNRENRTLSSRGAEDHICALWERVRLRMKAWTGSFFPSSRRLFRSSLIWGLKFSTRSFVQKHLACNITPSEPRAHTHACHFCHVSGITMKEECGVILKRWTAKALWPPAGEWGFCRSWLYYRIEWSPRCVSSSAEQNCYAAAVCLPSTSLFRNCCPDSPQVCKYEINRSHAKLFGLFLLRKDHIELLKHSSEGCTLSVSAPNNDFPRQKKLLAFW